MFLHLLCGGGGVKVKHKNLDFYVMFDAKWTNVVMTLSSGSRISQFGLQT